MPIPFFDLTRQNEALKGELETAVKAVVNSGHYILGENVSAFEKEAAAYCGTRYAVGVASGTDALHLGLLACGVRPGDEVLTAPFTFIATAEAIAYCGATPVFVDIEPNTFNIDPDLIEKKITKKTKAILPVHLYGLTANMQAIMKIAEKYSLKVIEDCAQSMGAEQNGKKGGSFGDTGCFSFFPTKNLGCFGDGGLVTTNAESIYNAIKALRGHGSRQTYFHAIIGYNSRLDEIQAAILRVKLPHLNNFNDNRAKNSAFYCRALSGIAGLTLPVRLAGRKHSWNQFTIRIKERDLLIDFLKLKGIGAMIYYPLSIHLQKAFSYLDYKLGDFPESEKAQNEVISLPIYPELSQGEIEAICAAIKDFVKRCEG